MSAGPETNGDIRQIILNELRQLRSDFHGFSTQTVQRLTALETREELSGSRAGRSSGIRWGSAAGGMVIALSELVRWLASQ